MWKYVTKKQSNDFLLSLFLIDNKSKNEYIREIYALSNNIPNNYKVFKIKKNSGGEEYLDSLYGKILFVNSINSSLEFRDYKIYIERLKYRR